MKFIHCADLHLDSPMGTHMDAAQASKRNTEIIHSFLRLTEYARENAVRAVLIAGDLFDGARITRRTVEEILDAVVKTPEVDYLFIPGNHDGAARALSDRALPPNFIRFPKQWKTVTYGNIAVSGIEMCRENAESLYDALPQPEGTTHIVMLHGQVGTASGEDLVNLPLLQNRGIVYLALGHLHSFCVNRLGSSGVYAYCGCLEGRGFDECGPKGFVLLEAENGKVTPTFVPFACRELRKVDVDITGLQKNAQIFQAMQEAAKGISREHMVEFLLQGHTSLDTDISVDYLQNLIGDRFFFTKVKNLTTLALDPKDYENDISLKGEFIRLVMSSDRSEEEKVRLLRLGLLALAGEELSL